MYFKNVFVLKQIDVSITTSTSKTYWNVEGHWIEFCTDGIEMLSIKKCQYLSFLLLAYFQLKTIEEICLETLYRNESQFYGGRQTTS